MALPAIPIISGIISLFKMGGDLFGKWQERKMVKAQGKIEIEKAVTEGKIKQIQTTLEGDIQYDLMAQDQMKTSWKDELWTIWMIAVLTACFIPGAQDYVKNGFEFLKSSTPEWFSWAVLGAIVASFGLKDWFKKLVNK